MGLLEQIGTLIFRNVVSILNHVPRFQLFLRVLFGFLVGSLTLTIAFCRLGFKRVFLTRVNRTKLRLPDFANKLGTHSTFTTKEGIKLHMVVKGDPKMETILFLHGFPDCWISWKNQINFFCHNKYRCVALSTRGYVDSTKSSDISDFVVSKLIDDVKETISFLGVESIVLVGHDWGGLIASSFAAKYPDMVKKLVVLNFGLYPIFSNLLLSNPKQFLRSWYIFFFQLPFLPELNLKMGDYVPLELMFQTELEEKGKSITNDELNLRKFYCSQPGTLNSMINYYRGLFHNVNDSLSGGKKEFRIKVPSKFIWGEADKYLIVENLDGLDKYIDDVTVVKIPNAGHFVQLEAPDEVNNEILSFIK